MASEQELQDSATAHARKTTIRWDEFLARVAKDPHYQYAKTHWFMAGRDLERLKALPPDPVPPPPTALTAAQGRIFLAQQPLDALQAPKWMVPVCTADPAYRSWFDRNTVESLRMHFGRVEAWCDCSGTPYTSAEQMVRDLGLDGPAWGQCETTAQFDHAYAHGCRRMVGSIDANVLDEGRLNLVKSGTVLVSVELYRNCNGNLLPDWRNANNGVGGNCIACYRDAQCQYMPVARYISDGMYVPHRDSLYGVGLQPSDWPRLAG